MKERAFATSVRKALAERRDEAIPVIRAELAQIDEKGVIRGVHTRDLTELQRKAIIRSSMFLKDKYSASGVFEKYKARLVAGGDQQDKTIYEDLSSPTAATTSIMTIVALAAREGRRVMTMDVGGAYLNASMAPTGVKVHMRLDRTMTGILVDINPKYKQFLEPKGTMVVALEKALYGCVEAASLWHKHLSGNLEKFGFRANRYDCCIMNKLEADGSQTTIGLHVDDILISNVHSENLTKFGKYLNSVYPKTSSQVGPVVDFIGMTFDFRERGKARVTMANCEREILAGCGVTTRRATPATDELFEVRDAELATKDEAVWFHSHVAKMLYLAKRTRPECLAAVSFLATRVKCTDRDDIGKLKRLLGYLRGSEGRGIVLEIGPQLKVRTFIDAAYGVHMESGRSHAGCVIMLGAGGPIYAKSSKQKTVAKSSTESELMGLSDHLGQTLQTKNFLEDQGHDIGEAIVFQDNTSTMALVKRGRPGSEASRHIAIRYFWAKELVDRGEIKLVHCGTKGMWANLLTKPVQGAQFVEERKGLTNWSERI